MKLLKAINRNNLMEHAVKAFYELRNLEKKNEMIITTFIMAQRI